MNLKPVELQVALPRTAEAGIQQKNQMDRPVTEQQMLAAATIQEESTARKRASKADESAESDLRDAQHQKNPSDPQHHRKNKKESSSETWKHPHKGHHIDYTL
ncbi:hypothetical protein [Marinicrinis lubricantis]|uniref:Uncharacterized protein n=1 Tax=Marinicrinis lubricantis TaxID=2086470 RepID=A0ABW1IMC3_9BACL